MSVVDFLDNLFIRSLLLIYDDVFNQLLFAFGSPGWGLVAFSVIVNLALLPIYLQMERSARSGVDRREAMNKEIARIKAHYKGRERYFYIRTIHRHFGYRPISAVFSSGDLYLQILVFATVYRYLADHPLLQGASFLTIPDLGRPDGLLFGLNLLPILMTLFNGISAMLYDGEKAKRRNAFILALLFLILLYRTPAGLVLYWTCNNAFSLVRNLIDRKIARTLPPGWSQRLSDIARRE